MPGRVQVEEGAPIANGLAAMFRRSTVKRRPKRPRSYSRTPRQEALTYGLLEPMVRCPLSAKLVRPPIWRPPLDRDNGDTRPQ